MCTVTYIPLKQSVLFSSCRDESPHRMKATPPAPVKGKNKHLIFPKDGLAGGTWIGVNNNGYILIVLNGGFVNHEKRTHYFRSRGLIIKQLLDCDSPVEEWEKMDLKNIEPFTLIAFKGKTIHKLVWTGDSKSHSQPDPALAHIWSSATLYSPEVQLMRKKWFQTFLQQHTFPSSGEVFRFLVHDAPKDPENGFIMNRDELIKTCSVSLVEMKEHHAIFEYHDLLNETADVHHFFFDNNQPNLVNNAKETGRVRIRR